MKHILKKLIVEELSKLEEGMFGCTIEDLYKAVSEYMNKNFGQAKETTYGQVVQRVTLENSESLGKYINVVLVYSIANDRSKQNLSDEQIIAYLNRRRAGFHNQFLEFKNFCTKGVRSVINAFSSAKVISIQSSIQLDKNKHELVDPQHNLRNYEERSYRYTDKRVEPLHQQMDRRDPNLDVVKVSVSLFFKDLGK